MSGARVISRCRILAGYSEEPGSITRTFLCDAMRPVHAELTQWMEQAGMQVRVDNAGNLRGFYAGAEGAPVLVIGSHLDTVPRAGAFDGILGVVLGVELVASLQKGTLPFAIEVVGFSEEEGVRFRTPLLGSRAFVGSLSPDLLCKEDANGISVANALRTYGLDPDALENAVAPANTAGYLEFHIEQGPVLEHLDFPLGVVESVMGQSRRNVEFSGAANHAGTTPMHLRHDALAGAAEWIGAVERAALTTPGLVATVGRMEAHPNAGNVIAGRAEASLDVRHTEDAVRERVVAELLHCAEQIGARRGLSVGVDVLLDQASAPMDPALTVQMETCVRGCGYPVHRMPSGAGHDAMVLAPHLPCAMLFLRSPGGVSHHPDETVLEADVDAALVVGKRFLKTWGAHV